MKQEGPLVVGIDPGIRNIGFYRSDETSGTLQNGRTLSVEQCLENVVKDTMRWVHNTHLVVVEETVWQGRRKGMLTLAMFTGAIVATALSHGFPVLLVTPAMKPQLQMTAQLRRLNSPHEIDAAKLAGLGLKFLAGGKNGVLQRRLLSPALTRGHRPSQKKRGP